MLIDILTDVEKLQGAMVGKTVKAAEIVQEDVLTDFLVLTMDDGHTVKIDTSLLFSVEVTAEGLPK